MNSEVQSSQPQGVAVAEPCEKHGGASRVSVAATVTPAQTLSPGMKSPLALDFRRSPDVIFAFGVGMLALYYGGWGLLKLIQLVKG